VAAGPVAALGPSCYGNISALNPATGAIEWQTCTGGFMPGGATVVPGLVIESYVSTGSFLFLDTATGNIVQLMNAPARSDGEVTVSSGILYFVGSDGELYAYGQ
jgi:outer membrane protein assembly factor BamB